MALESIFLIVAFAGLCIGTAFDVKTREVPDWLNFSLIAVGLGFRLIYSFAAFDWSYIIEGLAGFGAFFLFALVMFYTGQWGGGDAKMLMGFGALLGIRPELAYFSIAFIVNTFIIGAFYGLFASSFLALRNKAAFVNELKKLREQKKVSRNRKIMLSATALLLLGIFLTDDITLKMLLAALIFLSVISFYLSIFVVAVEKSCMLKEVRPEKLTEGDWIAENVFVGKKLIASPKDLGVSKKQISLLKKLHSQRKIKTVLIKEGLPFTPSFLIAFLITYFAGNLILLFV